jgi:4'-phosphopantetheinyl transferase
MLDPLELTPLALGEPRVEVRVLDLTQLGDLEPIAARYLTASEQVEYADLRHPLRRREWLGARVCLKLMVLRAALIADPLEGAVIKDPRGRPRLVFAPALATDVVADCSLSHKGRFACAATSSAVGSRIGVDIEEVSPRLRPLTRQFAHERDTVIGSRPEEERLAIQWALKEAYSKAVGRGLAMALRAISCEEITPGRHRVSTTEMELVGSHTTHDGYVVALCFGKDQTRAG